MSSALVTGRLSGIGASLVAEGEQAGRADRVRGPSLMRASADGLPFADGSFDAVVSTLIFHHLPTETKQRALREVHRVLAPHGRFLLVDFGRADTAALRALVWSTRALRLPEAPTLADHAAGRIPVFLEEAGFAACEVAPRRRGIRFLRVTKRQPVALA